MRVFLIFLIIEIKLNIVFAMSIVSCYIKNLSQQYIKVVKIMLRYIKSFRQRNIIYDSQKKLLIEEYSNSNWAGNLKR